MKNREPKANLIIFIVIVIILIITGLIFIYSASSIYSLEQYGQSYYFLKKQIIALFISFIILIILEYIPKEKIKQYTPLFFIISIIITLFTFVPKIGIKLNGSRRWIRLLGINFQPSELLKTTSLLYLAYLIDKKNYEIQYSLRVFLKLLSIIFICTIILLKQPDFGHTVIISFSALIVIFIANCKLKHMFYSLIIIIIILMLVIYIKEYRLQRILTFLNPWQDQKGTGFQIIQSLIAIGSGNLTGKGIARSKQKFFYLPMQHTDFIFSIIAEELGFLGASTIIILYILLFLFGLKIAKEIINKNSKDLFSYYTVIGYIILINLQTVINLLVTTGLAPTKGIGLPFISYGSSALICNILMIGIIKKLNT